MMMMMMMMTMMMFQTYSKEAIDMAQEALTVAQKTRHLPNSIFEVRFIIVSMSTIMRAELRTDPHTSGGRFAREENDSIRFDSI